MVCSVGSVKMAVMARLLTSGSFSQAVTEKAGRQKLVAQYIQKELLEADDANLLNEEDMHVFDLNPLRDPLHLVSCNSCKKPIKVSQFVAHAELCKSVGFAEELLSELDSGTGNKKPPRKERKKSTAGNQKTSTGDQERFAIVDASETAMCNSELIVHVGIETCLEETKETLGNSGSDDEMIPLTKRPKLVASDTVQFSEDMGTVQGVSNIISCQDVSTHVAAPLATKAYYSQRNNRLKGAISYMYHQASIKGYSIDKREVQGNLVKWDASLPRIFSDEQLSDHFDKKHVYLPNTQNADPIDWSSKVSLVKNGCQTSDNSLNQVSLTNACTSPAVAFGAVTTKYHSLPYSLPGKSGTPLPPNQQPNGTVPVV